MSKLHWPSTPPSLIDGDLHVRGWEAKDAGAVHAACQDPDIQRWTRVPSPYLREDAAGFVGPFSAGQWAAGTGGPLAAVSADTDEVLGACGLNTVDATDLVAEVGYWVAPWARGRNVARRATRLLADWAFGEVGLQRLELYVEPSNAASRAVAESLGCQQEGVLRSKARLRGERRDMVLYALVKP